MLNWVLYEHYCNRKYGDNLDEFAEGDVAFVLDNPLLKSIAASHGKSVAQVVIRWVMLTGVLPLAKSVTPSRIKENIDVFDFELSQQEMFEIASLKADRIGSDLDTCDFWK